MSGSDRQFAWRGAIMAGFFVILAAARSLSDAPLQPGGLLLVALAMAFRIEAGRHIGPHSNGGRMEGGGLATGGPYAYSRHPLYLSNLAAAAGLLVFANCLPPWGMASLFLAAGIHHLSLARAEEAHLLGVHGDAYRSYMQVTPRWLGLPRRGGSAVAGAAGRGGVAGAAGGPGTEAAAEAPGTGGATGIIGAGGPARAALAEAWRRQGANLAKTGGAALCLWVLALA